MSIKEKISTIKYSGRDFRGDVVAGSFNGAIFGLIYSFYFLPIDRLDQNFSTYKYPKSRYFLINTLKMAAGFAIMRCTYNALKKQ